MKMATKAALFSALIFPGAGHFYLKKHISGTLLAAAAVVSGYYLVSKAVENALQIVEKIQSGTVSPDVAVITELVTQQLSGADAQKLDIATYVIIIAWLIGIADSYRLGRLQDKNK